jgi:hypothetical protein
MVVTQEFVVIPVEGGVRVHGVPDFPLKTSVGWTTDLTREINPEELVPWEEYREELLRSAR